jgi:hypothetical protein
MPQNAAMVEAWEWGHYRLHNKERPTRQRHLLVEGFRLPHERPVHLPLCDLSGILKRTLLCVGLTALLPDIRQISNEWYGKRGMGGRTNAKHNTTWALVSNKSILVCNI